MMADDVESSLTYVLYYDSNTFQECMIVKTITSILSHASASDSKYYHTSYASSSYYDELIMLNSANCE